MEIKIKDYVIRPDNGTTWQLSKIATSKEKQEQYETGAIYPRDLLHCILRIREDLRRDDLFSFDTLDKAMEHLENIDKDLLIHVEKALKEANIKHPNK